MAQPRLNTLTVVAGTHQPQLRPNPSLKRSANGRPPGPAGRYGVHFLPSGPGVLPSAPA